MVTLGKLGKCYNSSQSCVASINYYFCHYSIIYCFATERYEQLYVFYTDPLLFAKLFAIQTSLYRFAYYKFAYDLDYIHVTDALHNNNVLDNGIVA